MKARRITALAVNLAIIAMEIAAIFMTAEDGARNFMYYTQDSNYVLLAACAAYAATELYMFKSGGELPLWIKVFKYVAACLVAETFFVVLFILAPAMGGLKYAMLDGAMVFLHFLCPLFAMVSLLLLEDTGGLEMKHIFYAMLPTLAYEIVSATLNILRIWNGPYPFLKVYQQPVYMSVFWALAVPGLGLACAFLFMKLVLRKRKN